MNKNVISLTCAIILILLIGTLLVSCGTSATPAPLDGQTLMQERCSVCHSLDRVTSAHKTADQWTVSVDRMVARGAQLTTQEQQTLIAFLAANY
jgi:cytochrome c5